MSNKAISFEVSESLYKELEWAQKELSYPDINGLVAQAVQRYIAEIHHETWWREFRQLQQQVRSTGGFKLGETKEEIINKLREQRRQIFESEYANLH
jgi:hypothetical protein